MVADDPTVERYLCRDADCRLSAEEATLVDQWIASNKRFHIIRDHVLHDDLMLAGMWGGVASPDLGMEQKIAAYFNGRPTAKYGHDQRFLAQGIWPLVRKSALVHDRYYWTPGLKSVHHKFKVELGAGHVQTQQVERQAKNLGLID